MDNNGSRKRSAPSATWPDAVDEARRVYNTPVRKQGTLNARGYDGAAELVANKLSDFCKCFSRSAQVHDLLSKKVILNSMEQIRTRYQTVFRESGEELQVCGRKVFFSSCGIPVHSFILTRAARRDHADGCRLARRLPAA